MHSYKWNILFTFHIIYHKTYNFELDKYIAENPNIVKGGMVFFPTPDPILILNSMMQRKVQTFTWAMRSSAESSLGALFPGPLNVYDAYSFRRCETHCEKLFILRPLY